MTYVIVASGLFGAGIGYLVYESLLFLLPRKLRQENLIQRKAILAEAQMKLEAIGKDELARETSKIEIAREELDQLIRDRTSDLETLEQDLEERAKELVEEEEKIKKRERELELLKQRDEKAKEELSRQIAEQALIGDQMRNKLAQISSLSVTELKTNLVNERTQKVQIETAKHLKLLAEDIGTNSQRLAARVLARTHARYAPEFVWPKGINHVELPNPKTFERLSDESCTLLNSLTELSEGVTIALVVPEREDQAPVVRFAGGYGIYKEAAKLALEEMFNRGGASWEKPHEYYAKHRAALEQKAAQLGRAALEELKLNGMHIEILKMVGALNWRTSYRQNQYHHSVEVAKLAGVLANELGVDPDQAKRCGLLHDIGKAIDYRIEGSHAVISGDYADRFGEGKTICDTVMSHHADLIVETPLAYVLQSADTLSGARPGARVNLEEGYQDRLSSIEDVIRAFPGVMKIEIMNGAREVHVEVNHKRVREEELAGLASSIAHNIEENVAYPGQIKILVTRRFESVAVA